MSLRRIKTNEIFESVQYLKVEKLSEMDEYEKKLNKIKVKYFAKCEDYKTKCEDYKTKCGEIFVSNNGQMYFICLLCDLKYEKADFFENHIFQQHNLEVKGDDCSEDFPNSNHSDEDDLEASFKIDLDEYNILPSSVIEKDSEVDPKITSANKDCIRHFIYSVDDTLYGITKNEIENENSYLIQPAASMESTNTEHTKSEKEETADSKFYCDICNKRYKTKRGVANHRRRHDVFTPPTDILFSSDNSDDEESKSKSRVKTQIISLKCKYCSKQFSNLAQRSSHEMIHTGEKPFKCQECGNVFRLNRQLEAHMRVHTGERPYSCPKCPAKFANNTNRNVHLRAHLGIKRFSCDVCDKRFVRNIEKSMHMRIHTGEKPYQCELCGTRFNATSKLNEHMKRHTNTRPFQCETCLKYYYSKKLLKNHQAMHSDEKPFACDVCNARFPRKRAMQCHMKLHSNVKEYVCNICGKAFAQNAGLYGHMKSHGLKPGIKKKQLENVTDGS